MSEIFGKFNPICRKQALNLTEWIRFQHEAVFSTGPVDATIQSRLFSKASLSPGKAWPQAQKSRFQTPSGSRKQLQSLSIFMDRVDSRMYRQNDRRLDLTDTRLLPSIQNFSKSKGFSFLFVRIPRFSGTKSRQPSRCVL